MATKVLDVDVENLPEQIVDLIGYDRAFLLIRFRGIPVGQVEMAVVNGRINQLELHTAIHNPDSALWQRKLEVEVGWPSQIDHFPKATIAICTRDRPEDMRRCLDGLMLLPDDGQEILIIDNAPSTDATQTIAAEYGNRVRYIQEPRPGLNIARNRALREAKHEIILFNDDDATPDPNWLRAILPNFADPDVLCVTGLTLPIELENDAQEWFERYSPFGRGYRRVLHYGSAKTAFSAGHVGVGANMAFRRDVLTKAGGFDEALDAGTATLSGGDTEMFARVLFRGYHIVYDPSALSWHRHRNTWAGLRRTAYGYGVGIYASWTRTFLKEQKPGVLLAAWYHFRYYQLPLLIKSLLRYPDRMPMRLLIAELWGCLQGPRAYFKAVRQLKAEGIVL